MQIPREIFPHGKFERREHQELSGITKAVVRVLSSKTHTSSFTGQVFVQLLVFVLRYFLSHFCILTEGDDTKWCLSKVRNSFQCSGE